MTTAWFRSQEMQYVSLVVQEHRAHATLSKLGGLGVLQFTDLNPELTAFQRRYINEIQRCDELERKIKYFDDQLVKFDITPQVPQSMDVWLDVQTNQQRLAPTALLDELELKLGEKEKELLALNANGASLTQQYNSKVELKYVLDKTRQFASVSEEEDLPAGIRRASTHVGDEEYGNTNLRQANSMSFRFIAGVVPLADRVRFERMVFRATRSNCYMRFESIEQPIIDPATNSKITKDAFIIFYQSPYIENKIRRICDAFNAHIYDVPAIDDVSNTINLQRDTEQEISEHDILIRKINNDMMDLVREISNEIHAWRWTIKREKSIYHTLNHFMADVNGILRAEGWVVSSAREQVAIAVRDVHASTDQSAALHSWVTILPEAQWPKQVPTFFETNKFTESYQIIVDTYGVPHYQEANPALFTVISFPFMFGVMFGDIGHGTLLFLVTLLVIKYEKQISKMELHEVFDMAFTGRYILVLMGFFSVYAGFIYNDCFALGLKLFTPTWSAPESSHETLQQYIPSGSVYPIGVDPTWHIANNELMFVNSLKMKMAVTLGVIQMSGGLVLKIMNAIYNKPKDGGMNLDLWFEAVPQLIFMLSLFGYMVFLIVYKWSHVWEPFDACVADRGGGKDAEEICIPPNLITTLINIVLAVGVVDHPMFHGQAGIQVLLLLIAFCCIPMMLIPKPYYLIKKMKEHNIGLGGGQSNYASLHRDSMDHHDHRPLISESPDGQLSPSFTDLEQTHELNAAHDDDDDHSPGNIMIHQGIETIEFVLGCVSNTASYLRLWALSLAHSQLAMVFWEKCLLSALKMEGMAGVIGTFIGFAVWAVVTLCVLMVMDNLECFLHALRLHWVEFQNKFYKADGVPFAPLSFKRVLTEKN